MQRFLEQARWCGIWLRKPKAQSLKPKTTFWNHELVKNKNLFQKMKRVLLIISDFNLILIVKLKDGLGL